MTLTIKQASGIFKEDAEVIAVDENMFVADMSIKVLTLINRLRIQGYCVILDEYSQQRLMIELAST
jgi:hypothetical protein